MENRFRYYSLEHAARELRMPVPELRRLIERGAIHGIRMKPLHWLWLVPVSEVRKWQAAQGARQ